MNNNDVERVIIKKIPDPLEFGLVIIIDFYFAP